MVKMGGMPKRLDRLIEEVRHIEQVSHHNTTKEISPVPVTVYLHILGVRARALL